MEGPARTYTGDEARQIVGIVVGMVVVFVLAIIAWIGADLVSRRTLLLSAVLGGGVAGRIVVPGGERMRAHLVAMASGAAAAVGGLALTWWWLDGRGSVLHVEIIGSTLIGALPGVVIGKLVYRRIRRRESPLPPAVAREAGAPDDAA